MVTALVWLGLLAGGPPPPLPPGVVVALTPRVVVAATELTLDQVATITAPPELAAALGAVTLGSAPVAGLTRTIEAGYVRLRLRRYGFDPDQLALRGEAVTVVRAGTAAPSSPTPRPASPAFAPRRNETVTVAVRCGGVTVNVEGRVVSLGPAADTVQVFLPPTGRTVPMRLLGPGLVALDLQGGN